MKKSTSLQSKLEWLTIACALAIFLISAPQKANAAIAFVSSSSVSATAAATSLSTGNLSVTANNLLVIGCRHGSTFVAPTSATDTVGTVFTAIKTASDTNDGAMTLYWGLASSTSATDKVTCNFASSVSFRDLNFLQYSGTATTSVLDASSATSTATLTQSSWTSAPITTVSSTELVVSYAQNGGGNSMTSVTGGITIRTNLDAQFIGVASGDMTTSSILTGYQTTWSDGAATSWMIINASFRSPPAGGGGGGSGIGAPVCSVYGLTVRGATIY